MIKCYKFYERIRVTQTIFKNPNKVSVCVSFSGHINLYHISDNTQAALKKRNEMDVDCISNKLIAAHHDTYFAVYA